MTISIDQFNEQDLIQKAQSGNEEALEVLLKRYQNFLYYITSGYYLQDGDHDDLMQEARLGFYQAVMSYQSNKGTQFKNFAWLCVSRELDTCVKRSNRKKHKILNEAMTLPQEDPDSPNWHGYQYALADRDEKGNFSTPENDIMHNEILNEVTSFIRSALSKMEFNILLLRTAGLSYDDITKTLNLESKSVDNAIQRIRKKVNPKQLKTLFQV